MLGEHIRAMAQLEAIVGADLRRFTSLNCGDVVRGAVGERKEESSVREVVRQFNER